MSDKITAVLAGCGSMSSAWLDAVRQIEGVEIIGLVDIREQAAVDRASEYGLTRVVTGASLEAVIEQTRPHVVFDCTVPEAHFPTTMTALGHGCHVMGEKPLADTMEHAREMVAAARAAGKIYAVIQNQRYVEQARRVRQLAKSPEIGRITTLNSDFYIGAHFGGFRDRMQHPLLLDMAIHTFDKARMLCGADPVSVYCRDWNPSGSWYDHAASAVAIFEMTGGIIYTYRGSWCAEGLNTPWDGHWRILAERGSVTWDGGDGIRAQAVSKVDGFMADLLDIPAPTAYSGNVGGHVGLIREFVECVRTGGVPETICTDNIKSLAMVLGAIESAETGQLVVIK